MWGPSTLEWVLTQFATCRIGAVMVNINPVYRVLELEYALHKVLIRLFCKPASMVQRKRSVCLSLEML